MLGNDQYGDCVAVTWANVRRLVTATLTTETYPDLAAVEALYRTQNPGFPAEDNGMDIQTCLEYLATTGGPDGTKAIAFATVDLTNVAEVDAAIAIFGSVWTGIVVRQNNMTEFDHGQPWDYDGTSPIAGGHSVIVGGYTGQPGDDERFITWAAETGFTDAFWGNAVEEAWVVIWPEHFGTKAFETGIDTAALAAAYQAITGRVLPVPPSPPEPPSPPLPPSPPPVPIPPPPAPPGPSPAPPGPPDILAAIEAFLAQLIADIEAFLGQLGGRR